MKTLLINPPPLTTNHVFQYSLGLLYLAGAIENKENHVLAKDYFSVPISVALQETEKTIKEYSPNILGLSCTTRNRIACFKIIELAKKIDPKIKIILGGVHASAMYEQIALNFLVDVIVIGEGEITFPELIESFKKNVPLDKIKGIAFKNKDGRIKVTAPREPIIDLDILAIPNHAKFKNIIDKTRVAVMLTSRGCPFRCVFCSTTQHWGLRWRPRSPKNVVDEMEYLAKTFPLIEKIFFHDDTFTFDNKRVIEICDEIKKRKLKINWDCSSRVDRIEKDMLIKMKDAGCVHIAYGAESCSVKILKNINKGITKEHIKKTFKITEEVGLPFSVFLMTGNPGETWETIRETAQFLKNFKSLYIGSISKLEVYPGTDIHEFAKKQGILNDEYWLTNKDPPIYTAEHSESELTKMAYYIIAKNRLNHGFFNFLIFAVKSTIRQPDKAFAFIFSKLKNK